MPRRKEIPALKLITATHRKDRESVTLAQVSSGANGERLPEIDVVPPADLFDEARAHWVQLVGAMNQYGLTILDQWAFTELCIVLGELQVAHRAMNHFRANDARTGGMLVAGPNGPVGNPLRREISRSRRDALALASHLSIGPLVRHRLTLFQNGALESDEHKKFFSG